MCLDLRSRKIYRGAPDLPNRQVPSRVSCWKWPISCSLWPIRTPCSRRAARRCPRWTPSTRTRSSIADLVVEGHQLVDPGLVDVGAEEVVEEAVRAVRRERHHRADRDVRPAGEDVHAEVRPEEVELAARQLAVEVHARAAALARRAVLAREPAVGRERVRRPPTRRAAARAADARPGSGSTRGSSRRRSSSSPRAPSPSACRSEASSTSSPSSATCAGIEPSASASGSGSRLVFTKTNGPHVSTAAAAEAELVRREVAAPRPSAAPSAASRRARTSTRGTGTAASRACPAPLGDREAAVAADVAGTRAARRRCARVTTTGIWPARRREERARLRRAARGGRRTARRGRKIRSCSRRRISGSVYQL